MRNFMNTNSIFYLRNDLNDDTEDYLTDFKVVIKQREQNPFPFLHQSPQISFRQQLVDYIKRVCLDRKFSLSCLHLAVYILDIFMDNHNIVTERLLLVANVCLLLAAKLEENTNLIPKIDYLNKHVVDKYKREDYNKMEILILKFFDFSIMFPTAAHYTYYFMQDILSEQDLHAESNIYTVFFNLHEAITKYLDRALNDVHYIQRFHPSKLSAAIIAASRTEVNLSSWSKQLEELTDYTLEELNEPMHVLLTLNQTNLVSSCPACIEASAAKHNNIILNTPNNNINIRL